jgi:hypothetical protein
MPRDRCEVRFDGAVSPMLNTINLQVSVALTTAALGSILVSQVGIRRHARGGWLAHPSVGGPTAGVPEMLMGFYDADRRTLGCKRSVRAVVRVEARTEITHDVGQIATCRAAVGFLSIQNRCSPLLAVSLALPLRESSRG